MTLLEAYKSLRDHYASQAAYFATLLDKDTNNIEHFNAYYDNMRCANRMYTEIQKLEKRTRR